MVVGSGEGEGREWDNDFEILGLSNQVDNDRTIEMGKILGVTTLSCFRNMLLHA